jgi:hypothetical protein
MASGSRFNLRKGGAAKSCLKKKQPIEQRYNLQSVTILFSFSIDRLLPRVASGHCGEKETRIDTQARGGIGHKNNKKSVTKLRTASHTPKRNRTCSIAMCVNYGSAPAAA